MGSQQVEAEGRRRFQGVFAIWYGKGPGLDRAGDAIKHGHAYGTSPHGGVLCVAGDDHGAVSSTVAHQSDQTFAAWWMPVLNPASVRDYLELGLWGWAASRFSGGWVGFKAIAETVESASTFELLEDLPVFQNPVDYVPPQGGVHFRWQDPPFSPIENRLAHKLDAVRAFARANPVDRLIVPAPNARVGIVTVGKAHGDVMEALLELGLAKRELARPWRPYPECGLELPTGDSGLRALCRGLERGPGRRGEAAARRGPDQGVSLRPPRCEAAPAFSASATRMDASFCPRPARLGPTAWPPSLPRGSRPSSRASI